MLLVKAQAGGIAHTRRWGRRVRTNENKSFIERMWAKGQAVNHHGVVPLMPAAVSIAAGGRDFERVHWLDPDARLGLGDGLQGHVCNANRIIPGLGGVRRIWSEPGARFPVAAARPPKRRCRSVSSRRRREGGQCSRRRRRLKLWCKQKRCQQGFVLRY